MLELESLILGGLPMDSKLFIDSRQGFGDTALFVRTAPPSPLLSLTLIVEVTIQELTELDYVTNYLKYIQGILKTCNSLVPCKVYC